MDSAMQPLISIIMPAHNAARFIGDAITSILQQTYPHWELLLVDDASTDDTANVVAGFSDPRIRYIPVPRVGSPSGVRNIGLRMAQGDFIAFLDADDLYFPETLEKLLTTLLENDKLTAVYGFASNMDESGQAITQNNLLIPLPAGKYALPLSYSHDWKWIITGNISCLLPALMLRKTTLDRIGLFNEDFYSAEDYAFYVRLFIDSPANVHCLPDYVYRYRVYSGSLTKTPEHSAKVLQSCIRVMNWLFTEARLPEEVYPLKSKAFVGCYRYLSRERLIHHQPDLARQIALAALQDTNIKFTDWLSHCFPLLIRSLLPSPIHGFLVAFRSQVRYRVNLMKTQAQAL